MEINCLPREMLGITFHWTISDSAIIVKRRQLATLRFVCKNWKALVETQFHFYNQYPVHDLFQKIRLFRKPQKSSKIVIFFMNQFQSYVKCIEAVNFVKVQNIPIKETFNQRLIETRLLKETSLSHDKNIEEGQQLHYELLEKDFTENLINLIPDNCNLLAAFLLFRPKFDLEKVMKTLLSQRLNGYLDLHAALCVALILKLYQCSAMIQIPSTDFVIMRLLCKDLNPQGIHVSGDPIDWNKLLKLASITQFLEIYKDSSQLQTYHLPTEFVMEESLQKVKKTWNEHFSSFQAQTSQNNHKRVKSILFQIGSIALEILNDLVDTLT